MKKKEVANITLDPNLETADCDVTNNYWPHKSVPSKFKLYKDKKSYPKSNAMQKARK
jgi:hypothetical protein